MVMMQLSAERAKRLKRWGEVCLVGLLILIVWALYSIPTIVKFGPGGQDDVSQSCNYACSSTHTQSQIVHLLALCSSAGDLLYGLYRLCAAVNMTQQLCFCSSLPTCKHIRVVTLYLHVA